MNKTRAMYAGSFDPFTNGHLDIVKEASKIFDEVIVCISVNSDKKRSFNFVEMNKAISECLKREGLTNCRVVNSAGLVANFCREHDIQYLVRGLRNSTDYQYEENIAKINHEINPELMTVYLRAKNEVVSSSMVKELLSYGVPVDKYVPEEVLKLLEKH